MMGRMRRLASRVGLVAVLTLSGCASWFMKGEAPEVLVTNVTPLDASAFEQRLQVNLRIRNPNDFDLAVNQPAGSTKAAGFINADAAPWCGDNRCGQACQVP